MKIDAVFSGGGVKAFALIGALNSIERSGLQIERVAGTSAGAIVASLIAANYKPHEIKQMIQDLKLESLLDPPKLMTIFPFSKWLFLYFQLGFYKGNKFEQWIHRILAAKNIYTFQDIEPHYLKVVVSDLSHGKLVVIPDDLKKNYGINPNDFPVSKAIRMSAGYPYFFMPKKLLNKSKSKSTIVDGGLLSNFPIWIFENNEGTKDRPTLGVKLSKSYDQQTHEINTAIDMLQALIATMKQAHDERYISEQEVQNIIFIPVEDIQAVDMQIDDNTKDALVNQGQTSAEQFLKFWPK